MFKGRFVTRRRQNPPVVVVDLKGLALAHRVDNQQVAALLGELFASVAQDTLVLVAGFGREADDDRFASNVAAGPRFDEPLEDVVVAHEGDRIRFAGTLLDLRDRDLAGRKSATAADMITASAFSACLSTATFICWAVVTCSMSTAAGAARPEVIPAIRVTLAPRCAARRAIA